MRSHHDFLLSKKRPYIVNFLSKLTSKWPTDPLRARHVTYPYLPVETPVDDFGHQPQVIFRGKGQRHFPVSYQKDRRLTLP